jgi:hypothetical protein
MGKEEGVVAIADENKKEKDKNKKSIDKYFVDRKRLPVERKKLQEEENTMVSTTLLVYTHTEQ